MTFDREGLQRWYRGAMSRRLAQLRDLRDGLAEGEPAAVDTARAVAQALRGSGATYGFPELSASAEMVESAPDASLYRRVEGLIEQLRALALGGPGGEQAAGRLGVEWLGLAAAEGAEQVRPAGFDSLEDAWLRVSARHDVSDEDLARRVADRFGLDVAGEGALSKAAMRLVPEALIRRRSVLPLHADAERVTVATADPTCLDVEAELVQLTGRTPVFVVLAPDELRRRIGAVLDGEDGSIDRKAEGDAGSGARLRSERRRQAATRGTSEDRVLVVDDDAPWRVLARSILEKGGYEVDEAGDGEEALDVLASSGGFELIVADLNMPRLDGLELIWAMRAREEWSEIPVIVVTGETDEILEAHLMEEGADDYIRKPLDPRLFLARVAATIRRAEH